MWECKLGDAAVQTATLQQLATTLQLHLPADVSLSDSINVYKALICQRGKLINTGEYICFSDREHVSVTQYFSILTKLH